MSDSKPVSFRGSRGGKRTGKPKLSASVIRSTARVQEMMVRALDLVVQGKGVKDVAKDLGVSDERARQLIDQCLAERQADVNARKDQVRTITLARLDAMVAELWPKRGSPYVVKVITELEDRRAKLLGLDQQIQEVNHTVNVNVSDAELLANAAKYGIAVGAFAAGSLLGRADGARPAAGGVREDRDGGQLALSAGLPGPDGDRLEAGAESIPPDRGGLAVGPGEDVGTGD